MPEGATRFDPILRRPMLAAVLGASAIAFSAVFVRLSGASPATAAVFRCGYAVPFLLLLARLEDRRYGRRPRRARRLALAAGVFFAADLVSWHYAIGAVGAGLATVLANLQVVVVALVAWAALGERPDAGLAIAIPVALLGLVLISGVLEEGAYGEDPALGVAAGMITALSYSGFLLLLREGGSDLRRPAGPLADATLVATAASALAGWASHDLDLVPSWPAHGWLLALALGSQVVGWLLISISLPRLPAAVTSVLLLVQPIVAVTAGVAILGERPSPIQLLGVALILSGVLVAARGRGRASARAAPGARARRTRAGSMV
ncbi:MAG TPA: DMT family transporter [Actinomycetota bacterium]|nr:DMT family transporter [Actinomycetota bacterium]